MPLQSSPVLSYRDDFSFRNSPAAIRRFPFPFIEDSYLYSVNIEPAISRDPGSIYEHAFDIDEHYRSEMAERAQVLQQGYDERFAHIWEFYLAYCEAAFAMGDIDVVQYTLVKP